MRAVTALLVVLAVLVALAVATGTIVWSDAPSAADEMILWGT